jgi:hypothetical protein
MKWEKVVLYLPQYFAFFSFLLLFYHFYIYLHVYTSPSPPNSPTSGLNLFCPLILRYCWRERIIDNKKDMSFLLVWEKDSHTERFLTLLPDTCVLQHFHNFLIPFPLYALIYREHINHIQLIGFLTFPYFSNACSPLHVWPMSNNITAFVLAL